VPFTGYKRHVIEGARHFDLDPAYIAEIEAMQTAEDTNQERAEKELRFPCDREVAEVERREMDCNGV
jgi:hypothetical protein